MNVLAMDASASAASACLWADGKLLGECYSNVKLTHSQTLLPMAQGLLQYTKVPLAQVDAFAVSAGPGSFTGVRIAVASVKGLAFAAGKPCAGVSTLAAMAENLAAFAGVACCVMDARCGQVYNALFRLGGDAPAQRLCPDRALPIEQLAAACAGLQGPLWLVGDGALLCARHAAFAPLHARLAPEPLRYQRASGVAALAARQGQFGPAAALLPFYLRPPQAQRSLRRTPPGV